jgi:hypothetical protein
MCIAVGGAVVLSLFATTSPASAQSALVDALSTRVTLAHAAGGVDEVVVERVIRSGDTVATNDSGRAVVTYPDGSTALLEENSALTIEFVQTSAGDYAVRMQQTLGRVWYAITRAVTLGSRYEVRTAGMASVIRAGSDSYVAVSPNGETTIVTISGTVDASAGGSDVTVPAGSSTTVSGPGATPVPVGPAPLLAEPAPPAQSSDRPAPRTPTPTASPSPMNPIVPAVGTLPPLPVKSATPKPRSPSPTILPAPRPKLAPAPLTSSQIDQFGTHEDTQGQLLQRTRTDR